MITLTEKKCASVGNPLYENRKTETSIRGTVSPLKALKRKSIAFKWERMSGMCSSEAVAVAMLTFPSTRRELWEGITRESTGALAAFGLPPHVTRLGQNDPPPPRRLTCLPGTLSDWSPTVLNSLRWTGALVQAWGEESACKFVFTNPYR